MNGTPARRFLCLSVCLSVCVALSALLATEALAAQGITRTAGEDFNGAQSITVLKGDTVWFWAEASIDGARCWWDEGPPLYWPLDEDMTWSVTQGDLDDSHQYYRKADWQMVEGGPPFPVLIEVVERWQGSKTFDSTGHFQFEVQMSYSGGPPYDPEVFTFEAYVVEAYVSSVALGLEYEGELYQSVAMRKSAGIPWDDMLYGDDGELYLPQPEWRLSPARALPVCFIKGKSPVLEVVLGLTPAFQGAPSLPLQIVATSSGMTWSGASSGFPEVEARVYTLDVLPEEVAHDPARQFAWQARAEGTSTFHDVGDIGVPFWVTWAMSSGSSRTAKRMDWVTDKAHACTGVASIGQAIWEALSGDPPYDPGEGTTESGYWDLLDGSPYYGWCNHQAALMNKALAMLGVASAIQKVYGSTADYNFVEPESRECPTHQWLEWLVINHGGVYHTWAACCVVPNWDGVWYCLYPVLYTSSDWHMCYYLVCAPNFQQWVKTNNNEPPGEGGTPPFTFCDTEPAPEP